VEFDILRDAETGNVGMINRVIEPHSWNKNS
jgi:hypothetical protein